MIEIEVQKAFQGDCIWIRCIAKKNVNIVVDAGPSTPQTRESNNIFIPP